MDYKYTKLTKEKLIEELKRNGGQGANLDEADLSGADLQGVNLELASLKGAKLANVNLEGANLANADLTTADLYNANLNCALIMGTDFINTCMQGIKLKGAYIFVAEMRQGIENIKNASKVGHWFEYITNIDIEDSYVNRNIMINGKIYAEGYAIGEWNNTADWEEE